MHDVQQDSHPVARVVGLGRDRGGQREAVPLSPGGVDEREVDHRVHRGGEFRLWLVFLLEHHNPLQELLYDLIPAYPRPDHRLIAFSQLHREPERKGGKWKRQGVELAK